MRDEQLEQVFRSVTIYFILFFVEYVGAHVSCVYRVLLLCDDWRATA